MGGISSHASGKQKQPAVMTGTCTCPAPCHSLRSFASSTSSTRSPTATSFRGLLILTPAVLPSWPSVPSLQRNRLLVPTNLRTTPSRLLPSPLASFACTIRFQPKPRTALHRRPPNPQTARHHRPHHLPRHLRRHRLRRPPLRHLARRRLRPRRRHRHRNHPRHRRHAFLGITAGRVPWRPASCPQLGPPPLPGTSATVPGTDSCTHCMVTRPWCGPILCRRHRHLRPRHPARRRPRLRSRRRHRHRHRHYRHHRLACLAVRRARTGLRSVPPGPRPRRGPRSRTRTLSSLSSAMIALTVAQLTVLAITRASTGDTWWRLCLAAFVIVSRTGRMTKPGRCAPSSQAPTAPRRLALRVRMPRYPPPPARR